MSPTTARRSPDTFQARGAGPPGTGAGWIDSIEESDASKIRYRCPNCGSTDFKYRSTQQFAYRCAKCGTEFNDNDRREEELTVHVFTANYSRTFRLADRPFPVKALDPAYILQLLFLGL